MPRKKSAPRKLLPSAEVVVTLVVGLLQWVVPLTRLLITLVWVAIAGLLGLVVWQAVRRWQARVAWWTLIAICSLVGWTYRMQSVGEIFALPAAVILDFGAGQNSHEKPFPFRAFVTNRGTFSTRFKVTQNCGIIASAEPSKLPPCKTNQQYLHAVTLDPSATSQIDMWPLDGDWESHLGSIATGKERAYGYLKMEFDDESGAQWEQEHCWVFFRWEHEAEFQQCRRHNKLRLVSRNPE